MWGLFSSWYKLQAKPISLINCFLINIFPSPVIKETLFRMLWAMFWLVDSVLSASCTKLCLWRRRRKENKMMGTTVCQGLPRWRSDQESESDLLALWLMGRHRVLRVNPAYFTGIPGHLFLPITRANTSLKFYRRWFGSFTLQGLHPRELYTPFLINELKMY